MLIDSPRITPGDHEAWNNLARYDQKLATNPRLTKLEATGIAALKQWADQGPGVIATSWGKDSVIVAHLAMLAGINYPIVWVRADPFEMPECEQVRDEFLRIWPEAQPLYEERTSPLRNPKRGEPGYDTHRTSGAKGQDILNECITERYASGVRAQESRTRTLSMNTHGMVTKNTCRPLGRWTGVDVFTYLARHDLPIHPAYAMSINGARDRQWLRVHPLCHFVPTIIADLDRWEDRYYADHIEKALAIRAAWRQAGDPRGGINVLPNHG